MVASASASAAAASLRRASSIRRTQAHAGAAIKRKSLCLQVKFTADAIIEILRKTSVFYVYTMIANQTPSINSVNDDLNVPMLRSQVGFLSLIKYHLRCSKLCNFYFYYFFVFNKFHSFHFSNKLS